MRLIELKREIQKKHPLYALTGRHLDISFETFITFVGPNASTSTDGTALVHVHGLVLFFVHIGSDMYSCP